MAGRHQRLAVKTRNQEEWNRRGAASFNGVADDVDPELVRVSGNYTASVDDRYIGVTDTTAARTVTLATGYGESQRLTVKDESGAAGTNAITIQAGGSDTIDGAASVVINTNWGVVNMMADGEGKWIRL